ncbi:MAG TPA: ferredoxin--NADP reductase [Gammaproteobacteria bacterium]|nr:ferredoxin--NADP reductase [Gammaproteobacteria bacterium]
MAHPTRRLIVQWTKRITPMIQHLGFVPEDKQPIRFKAGQFITLNIEGPNKVLHRSYSIANAPGDDTVELACAYVEGGVATKLLFGLQPGDAVSASGPFGLFTLKEERPIRYVLIGTGTGVAPYRSMLKEIQDRFENAHPELNVALVLGVRNPKELLFGEEFAQFEKQQPRFKFYACYSQVGADRGNRPSENPASFERLGRVQVVFDELALNPENDIIYLCGNPNMIDENFTLLTEMGFDKKAVRREKYAFSH